MGGTSTADKGKEKAPYYFEIGGPGEAPDPEAWYGKKKKAKFVDHLGNEEEGGPSTGKAVGYFSAQKQPAMPDVQSQLNDMGGIPVIGNSKGKAVDYTFHDGPSATTLAREPGPSFASAAAPDKLSVRDVGVVQLLGAHQRSGHGNPYEMDYDGPGHDNRRCITPCNTPSSDYLGSRHSSSSSVELDGDGSSASLNMQPVGHPRAPLPRSAEGSEQESTGARLRAFGRRVLNRSGEHKTA
jgi:hypothetical protein